MISHRSICLRIGLLAGLFVGLLVSSLGRPAFVLDGQQLPQCTITIPIHFILAGIITGVVFAFLMALIHILLFRYPAKPLLFFAMIIGIIVGIFVGWLAFSLQILWSAALLGAFLGALLGWLICRIMCGSIYKRFGGE